MKKILSIALVALLAASAFAAFSGDASVDFGYNFDNQKFGFTNGQNIKVNLDIATAEADKLAEGEVAAGIKANFSLTYKQNQKNDADFTADGFKFKGKIKEAYVGGANWKLSILGANGLSNYATSAIDDYKKKDDSTGYFNYSTTFAKAPGVALELFGYKASFGLTGEGDKTLETSATFETPEYVIADSFKIGVGANYAFAKNVRNALSASVKTAFENDMLSLAVATDLGYDFKAEKFGADVAAKFAISPVTVDFYYATLAEAKDSKDALPPVENLLSAKVGTDLTAFDVPLKLTVTGKDLINKQNLSAEVVIPVAQFTFTVNGGYIIQDKAWNVGGKVEYAHDMFTVGGGVDVGATVGQDNLALGANAKISTKALVPGAELSLAWKDAKDLLKKDAAKTDFGQLVATCKIAF